jgi:hypothetical protein
MNVLFKNGRLYLDGKEVKSVVFEDSSTLEFPLSVKDLEIENSGNFNIIRNSVIHSDGDFTMGNIVNNR